MNSFGRRQHVDEQPVGRRSTRSHFADLGDRLARGRNRQDYEPPYDHDEPMPRFPIVRQGYDCAAVEGHIAELEQELTELDRELAELRTRPSEGEVQAEIHRIGEQTSTILLTAHDKAQETTRRAQAEADKCVADAAANALAITEDANRQLREIESEKDGLSRQREFLLRDIRGIASALSSLADDATERFAPEPARIDPVPAVGEQLEDDSSQTQEWQEETPSEV